MVQTKKKPVFDPTAMGPACPLSPMQTSWPALARHFLLQACSCTSVLAQNPLPRDDLLVSVSSSEREAPLAPLCGITLLVRAILTAELYLEHSIDRKSTRLNSSH